MNENSGTAHLSSHPDLLNIDREYADNLKILLDNSPSKGLEQLKVASICNDEKNDLVSKSNGITPSSTILPKKGPPLLVLETTASEDVTVPERDCGLKSIPEEAVSSYYKDDITNGVSFDQDSVRTFHTTIFLGNNAKPSNSTDLGKAVKVSTPVARSKSFGRKNMSARIQSLLEHFESSDRNFDSSSSLPEIPRNIEKRPAKQPSPEASMSENKFEDCQLPSRFRVSPKMWSLIQLLSNSPIVLKQMLRNSSPSVREELACLISTGVGPTFAHPHTGTCALVCKKPRRSLQEYTTIGMSNNERFEWKLNDFDMGIKDIVIEALSINDDKLRIAEHIKEHADLLYGGPHHCIVGKDFCGVGTQEKWMQCRMGDLKVYLYKSPRWSS
ncbi:hypothetical protein EGR_00993 [Echinococcus granulosus]|uniref:Uncharacterized protein n=2 Tax=Echinococcus granulosus TaxID=6210 RepID=W6VC79_ECHGR|nr:hypothetical protein EGR_00993 [Echinococcus granulosus]EUB64449.1 hypothetical protein EGR_00993 [Echinococcus granulosus]